MRSRKFRVGEVRIKSCCCALAFALALALPSAAAAQERFALIVEGAPGEAKYAEQHAGWREKLAKNRGYVLLAIFVIAAFLTPPDPVSQTLMALPMYALYEGGVLMSRLLVREKSADAERDPA